MDLSDKLLIVEERGVYGDNITFGIIYGGAAHLIVIFSWFCACYLLGNIPILILISELWESFLELTVYGISRINLKLNKREIIYQKFHCE